jgi:hypothetical protein
MPNSLIITGRAGRLSAVLPQGPQEISRGHAVEDGQATSGFNGGICSYRARCSENTMTLKTIAVIDAAARQPSLVSMWAMAAAHGAST